MTSTHLLPAAGTAAVSAFLCASLFLLGCGPGEGPVQVQPPAGNASVSGTVEVCAPIASLRRTSADQASPDATGQLAVFPEQGLFLDGYNPPAYVISPVTSPLQSQGGGHWLATFAANELAAGSYSMSMFYHGYGDFGAHGYWSQTGERKPVMLPAAAPLVLDPIVYDMGGVDTGHSCSGRILLAGNYVSMAELELSAMYSQDYSALPSYPTWSFGIISAIPARYYFNLDQIGPESCGLSAIVSDVNYYCEASRVRINNRPLLTGAIDLVNPQPVDLIVNVRAFSPTADTIEANRGQLTCKIKCTGALNWTSDILVIAQDVSGAAASDYASSSAYLFPEDIGLGGVITVPLTWLRAGSYQVDVYRLGADNTVARERIGGPDAPVALPLPAIIADPYNPKYTYQPPPVAEVSFDLNLPAGE
jgi:hypothetical protein